MQRLNLHAYVTLYKDQKTIDVCLMLFLFGKDGLASYNAQFKSLTSEEKQRSAESLVQEILDSESELTKQLEDALSDETHKKIEAEVEFEKLNEDEKQDLTLRHQFLWCHVLLTLHNLFSVMVNGESMVSLVPKALDGDDVSFMKALKIDRSLMQYHPYFIDRIERAKLNGEAEFLDELSKYQAKPNLSGRIKLPGLYIIFAMLEVSNTLDAFTHEEILDMCDAAKLDRWQNRIEDVNAVTKRLIQYRKYQKTGGVSMH